MGVGSRWGGGREAGVCVSGGRVGKGGVGRGELSVSIKINGLARRNEFL